MRAAVHVKDLYKKYPKTFALKGISLEIKPGDFFGLLGPNGAGKTTTISILTGLANKSEGEVSLFGKDVVTDYRDARALVGLVPQEFNMDMFEKVYNVLFFNAGYFGIAEKDRHLRIKKLLKQLDLWEKRDSKVRFLSGGMKRKLMIARALIHRPKILILDEPTAGVDVGTRQAMYDFFKKLNREGTTILLTTHYIEEAEALCRTIAVINKGEIVKVDSKQNLLDVLGGQRVVIQLSKRVSAVPDALQKYKARLEDDNFKICVPVNGDVGVMKKILHEIDRLDLPTKLIETERKTLEEIFLELTAK